MLLQHDAHHVSLILPEDMDVHIDDLRAPARQALTMFGLGQLEETRKGIDGLVLSNDYLTLDIALCDLEDGYGNTVLAAEFTLTERAPLPLGHAGAAEAILAELLHAGIEATAASQVQWQGSAPFSAHRFQTTVASIRGAVVAEDEVADEAPRLMPRRVRPDTYLRAEGSVVDYADFVTKLEAARRLPDWAGHVPAPAPQTKPAPTPVVIVSGESLQDVFRVETDLSPEIVANAPRAPRLERRVAVVTLTAALAMAGLGWTEAVASTLQALPF
ncbi:hypothetical protein [Pseudooceanicola sp. LIPI14-2-Ac024]|uniref:hypothetical protein n=1 Tax=Pseudooceanicola sp. LIPI14-2-Ac024 TaxID=3344875 RepID=UPI0035D0D206